MRGHILLSSRARPRIIGILFIIFTSRLPPLHVSAATKHNSIKKMKHYTCSGSGVPRIPVAPMAQGQAPAPVAPEPRPPPALLTPESHDPGPEPDTRENIPRMRDGDTRESLVRKSTVSQPSAWGSMKIGDLEVT